MDEEQVHLTRLVRALALFVFVPTATIGPVLLAYGWDAHWMHASAFVILALASVVVAWKAPAIAARFVTKPE